jgi:hypothetical protein
LNQYTIRLKTQFNWRGEKEEKKSDICLLQLVYIIIQTSIVKKKKKEKINEKNMVCVHDLVRQ